MDFLLLPRPSFRKNSEGFLKSALANTCHPTGGACRQLRHDKLNFAATLEQMVANWALWSHPSTIEAVDRNQTVVVSSPVARVEATASP